MKKIIINLLFILIVGFSLTSCKHIGNCNYHGVDMSNLDNIENYLVEQNYYVDNVIMNSSFYINEDSLKPEIHLYYDDGHMSIVETYNGMNKYNKVLDSLCNIYIDSMNIEFDTYKCVLINNEKIQIRSNIEKEDIRGNTYIFDGFEVEYNN